MKTIQTATLALLLIISTTYSLAAPPIIGGEEVSEQDPVAETTVLLVSGRAICTASLISRDLAVTAAHCVTDAVRELKPTSSMRVVFTTEMADLTKSAPVVGAVVPEGYQKAKFENPDQPDQMDIALIRFSGKLPSGYEPASLLPPSIPLKDGMPITLAGFGVTDGESRAGAGTLRKVEVTLYSARHGKTEVLTDQRDGKGGCFGDSGGPAFVTKGSKHYLFGVTDRGYEPVPGKPNCSQFGVYARIDAYQGFLKKAATQLRAIKAAR